MITRAYQLRDMVCNIYSAVTSQDPKEFEIASEAFTRFLDTKDIQEYLERQTGLFFGGTVSSSDPLFKNFVTAIEYKGFVLADIEYSKESGPNSIISDKLLKISLERDLSILSSTLAIMDLHEKETSRDHAEG